MTTDIHDAPEGARKPRIAVLGEFSSGKSTLANILLGHVSSPVRVTATQLPPIWYCHGEGMPVVVESEGDEYEIAPDEISSVPVDGTRYVRVYLPAELLREADLIDMPGSSDPNMSADVWNAVLPEADAAIWCTPATQAWRQSEAAIWDEVDPDLQDRSVLLLTRIDKVLSDIDRARLMKRVRRETHGMFCDVIAADLLTAQTEADADIVPERASEAGLGSVQKALDTVMSAVLGPQAAAPAMTGTDGQAPATVLRLEDHAPAAAARPATPVMPRRVTTGGFGAIRRPRRTSGNEGSSV
jgi:hypothetical protein